MLLHTLEGKGWSKWVNFTAYNLFFKQKKQWLTSFHFNHGLCAELIDHKYQHKVPPTKYSYVTHIPLASTDSQYRNNAFIN